MSSEKGEEKSAEASSRSPHIQANLAISDCINGLKPPFHATVAINHCGLLVSNKGLESNLALNHCTSFDLHVIGQTFPLKLKSDLSWALKYELLRPVPELILIRVNLSKFKLFDDSSSLGWNYQLWHSILTIQVERFSNGLA